MLGVKNGGLLGHYDMEPSKKGFVKACEPGVGLARGRAGEPEGPATHLARRRAAGACKEPGTLRE